MVYDSARQRTVLFGGSTMTAMVDETWEYDGTLWIQGPAAPPGLTARNNHAMSFDSSRDVAILFGGFTSAGYGKDTWEYDGAAWVPGSVAPPGLTARSNHAMAFDPVRGVTVLYGGYGPSGTLNDTWEYGTSWGAGAPPPPAMLPRQSHAMTYDPARGVVMVYGGYGKPNETWEYDGSTWTAGAAVPGLAPVTAGPFMAQSPSGHVTLLVRNLNDATYDWEHDGTSWIAGPAIPEPLGWRRGHAMVYDAPRRRVVLFGGGGTGTPTKETWEYDGLVWALRQVPATGLRPREQHAMAFDAARQRTVLFGGTDYSQEFDDTWEYDGSGWIVGPSAAAGLTPRSSAAMAFDDGRSVTVLFGGRSSGANKGDTWEYDGTQWTPGPAPAPVPSPRYDHAMVYDEARGAVLLFGGNPYLSDEWLYDGTTWTSLALSGPSGRDGHAMAFDFRRGLTVLFGGHDGYYLDDTWQLGATWSKGPAAPPLMGDRWDHAMAYVSDLGRVVLYGGSVQSGARETWEYACPITLSPSSLPAGAVGQPYSQTLVASGGKAPYAFAVTWGTLPPGLTLSGGGVLSGTPTAAGIFEVSIAATDSDGCIGAWPYRLAVSCPSTPITLSPPTLPPGIASSPYDVMITASGGTPPYAMQVTSGTLPSGLVLSLEGRLYGTPQAPGTYSFTVTGLDAMFCTGSAAYTLAIDCGPITIQPTSLPAATAGYYYSETLSASGGQAPYTFAVTSGSLPSYTSLSPSGTLSGIPQPAGSYSFSVTATDSLGCTGTRSYTLDVWCDGAMWLDPGVLPDGQVGRWYGQVITAHDGLGFISFAITGGALPPGLNLYGNYQGYDCSISGTPTTAGSFGFWLTATDEVGCSVSYGYSVNILPCSLTVSPPSLPAGTVGEAYVVQLGAAYGTPPYTFVASSGQLPPGLGLSGSGLISGVPRAQGSYSFTVTAFDSTGCTGSKAYTLAVSRMTDHVVGQGLGKPNPNRVRVFDAAGNATTIDFYAYAAGVWGVNVSTGDLDGGAWEALTAPGPGAVLGPHVRGFRRDGSPLAKVSFYACGTLRYGANVVGEGIDGDGFHEIVTGAGPGEVFGPQVRAFNVDGAAPVAIAKVNFFAYSTLRFGVNVEGGDVDADGFSELLSAPGPGPTFGSQARGWNYDGTTLSTIAKVDFLALPSSTYGAFVAGGDVDVDGFDEIAATHGPGPGQPSRCLGFNYDGVSVAPLPAFDVTPFSTSYGGRIALGDVGGSLKDDLVASAGRDPSATSAVRDFAYNGAWLDELPSGFTPFLFSSYGVSPAVGALGW